jgi:uncharacterized secreted repeat protein (TIGR03808 family)
MHLDRRAVLGAGTIGLAVAGASAAQSAGPRTAPVHRASAGQPATDLGIEVNSGRDQTAAFQRAIDRLAPHGTPLALPPGHYSAAGLQVRPGTHIRGVPGHSVLRLSEPRSLLRGEGSASVVFDGLVLDGRGIDVAAGTGLLDLTAAADVTLRSLALSDAAAIGLALTRSSGVIEDCTLLRAGEAAIRSLDATGLAIRHNRIRDMANNGILVWRSTPGEDGTIVSHNRINRVSARAGGSGQNGNGINVFRAGGVLVMGNRITDCAYSAIRANSAAQVQMTANSVARAGEVALYAEFAFEGALIASNAIEHAASGIVATNFNEGGRLAVISGNMIRTLVRRPSEPVDKRGEGIMVEADAVLSGNVIEGAETVGLMIGWHRFMRDVIATQNLIRNSPLGIAITADTGAGTALVTGNLISGVTQGAIRTLAGWSPVGPDLTRAISTDPRLAVSGNVAV